MFVSNNHMIVAPCLTVNPEGVDWSESLHESVNFINFLILFLGLVSFYIEKK